MPAGEIYVQLYTKYADHPALVQVAQWKEARAIRDLYVQMLCYAKAEKSDGFIPAAKVGQLVYPDPPKNGIRDADRLSTLTDLAGEHLVEKVPGGYNLPGFLKRNKSRAQIEEESARKAEAGRKGGQRSGAIRRGEASPKQGASDWLNTESEAESQTESKTSGTHFEGVAERSATAARETLPPRCSKHINDTDPPACRGCKAAREASEAQEKARAVALDVEARATAQARKAAIRACDLCGVDGWQHDDPTKRCTHERTAA